MAVGLDVAGQGVAAVPGSSATVWDSFVHYAGRTWSYIKDGAYFLVAQVASAWFAVSPYLASFGQWILANSPQVAILVAITTVTVLIARRLIAGQW